MLKLGSSHCETEQEADALERDDGGAALTSELGNDRERARGWTIAQTVAWSAGRDVVPEHVEAATWLPGAG